jgi:hypothetical protein
MEGKMYSILSRALQPRNEMVSKKKKKRETNYQRRQTLSVLLVNYSMA